MSYSTSRVRNSKEEHLENLIKARSRSLNTKPITTSRTPSAQKPSTIDEIMEASYCQRALPPLRIPQAEYDALIKAQKTQSIEESLAILEMYERRQEDEAERLAQNAKAEADQSRVLSKLTDQEKKAEKTKANKKPQKEGKGESSSKKTPSKKGMFFDALECQSESDGNTSDIESDANFVNRFKKFAELDGESVGLGFDIASMNTGRIRESCAPPRPQRPDTMEDITQLIDFFTEPKREKKRDTRDTLAIGESSKSPPSLAPRGGRDPLSLHLHSLQLVPMEEAKPESLEEGLGVRAVISGEAAGGATALLNAVLKK